MSGVRLRSGARVGGVGHGQDGMGQWQGQGVTCDWGRVAGKDKSRHPARASWRRDSSVGERTGFLLTPREERDSIGEVDLGCYLYHVKTFHLCPDLQ